MAQLEFDLEQSIGMLKRTPLILHSLLRGLPETWTGSTGNISEWEPYDIVGHLIHGEKTDWIPRARLILTQGEDRTFVPFDRLSQFESSSGRALHELLEEFSQLRAEGVGTLESWHLGSDQLRLKGMHPELGEVTLSQLIATWVVHDLNHIRQIVERLARRYGSEVGPWREYLSILK